MEYISQKVAICSLWTACRCFLPIDQISYYKEKISQMFDNSSLKIEMKYNDGSGVGFS